MDLKLEFLSEVSLANVFIIPEHHSSTGWKAELGRIIKLHRLKTLVFYESYVELGAVVADMISSMPIQQSETVDSNDLEATAKSVSKQLNSFIIKIMSRQKSLNLNHK